MNIVQRELEAFLGSPLKIFVDGRWLPSASGKTFETRDPGIGRAIATVAEGDAHDVDLAVKGAWKAFHTSGWATMAANDRAVILHRLADLIDQNRDVIAHNE